MRIKDSLIIGKAGENDVDFWTLDKDDQISMYCRKDFDVVYVKHFSMKEAKQIVKFLKDQIKKYESL